jgi:thymidylate synthase
MNKLDKQYQQLLQDIIDYGVEKKDRTGTGTKSIFGYTIRHKMSDGFPLLTTKKVAFKTMVTELLWFLKGDTNIKYLVDNDCHIWDGDAYKNYVNKTNEDFIKSDITLPPSYYPMDKEEFINKIKTDDDFAKKWGELGPIYGKQWRDWLNLKWEATDKADPSHPDRPMLTWKLEGIDQIANLINDLKTNPDSRRLMVNAWNVSDLDQMVLPPCHYSFQVYTRELSFEERASRSYLYSKLPTQTDMPTLSSFVADILPTDENGWSNLFDEFNIPTRAISLMWNQRSVDTFLGLPFNIASYGLLLEIIAKVVNMVPDELIGNLGDTHLYLNHIEQAKEQIGRDLTCDERIELASTDIHFDPFDFGVGIQASDEAIHKVCDLYGVPRRSRQPFELPTLNINTEFWQTESGECGVGPLNTNLQGFEINDFQLENYQSHPSIKAPLSN